MFKLLNFLRRRRRKKHKAARFQWVIGPVTLKRKETQMLEIKLTNEQKVRAELKPISATGKPAKIDGKPSWSIQSGDAGIEVAEDGMSATIISPDEPGDSIVLVEADADLGEGVEAVSDTIAVKTEHARAANLGLSLGTPEAK